MRFLILFFLFCSLPLTLSAQSTPGKVILVLDASGSMWGQIDTVPKISIARDVVKDLVADWDSETDLGLIAYGHRRKADCDDIESLVPVSPVQADLIKKKITAISPKGKTPLSRAVMIAADELKYTEEKATVILVSDGIETCDLDPCAVAKDLEAKGVDFTAHVIGFDVTDKEAIKQLTCLAENTGGRFLSASDATELKSSLDEAVQEIALAKKHNVKLVAVTEPGGTPLENVSWQVHSAANPQGAAVVFGRGATPEYFLEPGQYIASVKSVDGQASATHTFGVPEDESVEEEVVLAKEGILQLIAVNTEGGEPLDRVSWNVRTLQLETEAGALVGYGRGAQPEYKLLPGKYMAEVSSTDGKAKATQEVEVIGGKTNVVTVLLAEEGVLKLLAVNAEGGQPLERVRWTVRKPELETEAGEVVTYGGGAQPEYTLLPGKYVAEVTSVDGKATATQEVEVIAGKKNSVQVLLAEEGVLRLVARNTKDGPELDSVSWSVFQADSDKNVAYGRGATPEYTLLPGKYRATVKSVKGKASAEQEVEVVAGKRSEVTVLLPEEGIIVLKAVNEPGGTVLSEVNWTLDTVESGGTKGKNVTYGGGAQPEYRLLPGKYLAKVKSRHGKASMEQEVEVVPGKRVEIEVLMPAEGLVQLKAVEVAGASPLSEVTWEVYSYVAPDSIEKATLVTYGNGSEPEYKLLPGKYEARVRSKRGPARVTKIFEVRPGKRDIVEVLFPSEGEVELSAVLSNGANPGSVSWEIFNTQPEGSIARPERIQYGGGNNRRFRLLPGKYLAIATVASKKFEKEVEVLPGTLVKEELEVG